jgi:hypothetical protein
MGLAAPCGPSPAPNGALFSLPLLDSRRFPAVTISGHLTRYRCQSRSTVPALWAFGGLAAFWNIPFKDASCKSAICTNPRPIRKRVCRRRVAALRTHLRPSASFSRLLHHFPLQLALISSRMPHTIVKSTGSAIRLPVPLQPGRVRATTPVPRYKRWRLLIDNQPLVRVTARETSPLL